MSMCVHITSTNWVIFHSFLSFADFFKITFIQKFFRDTIRVSNSLDLDKARQNVNPDLRLYKSILICVQTVCKGYQQRALACKEFL